MQRKETTVITKLPIPRTTADFSNGPGLAASLGIYLLSCAVVSASVLFGMLFLERHRHETQIERGFVNSFTNWDGRQYAEIVEKGYSYSTNEYSTAAFFPAYPLIASCIARAAHLRTELALLCVSHLCLVADFILLGLYFRSRFPDAAAGQAEWTLVSFAFFPSTLFFRMAYTESLFVFCLLVAMLAMERDWPLLVVALVVGLATAARLVGVALLAPLVLYGYTRYRQNRTRLVEFLVAPLVGCWGIMSFMVYLWQRFGDPLAFVKAQAAWNQRPTSTWEEHIFGVFSFEPIWSIFEAASPAYWERYSMPPTFLFNMQALNVICFVTFLILILIGFARGILNQRELFLAALLLGIPYLAHSYQTLMWSEARFAAVVFPAYFVMGDFATRMPIWLASGALCLSAFFLGAYTALFAAWHLVF